MYYRQLCITVRCFFRTDVKLVYHSLPFVYHSYIFKVNYVFQKAFATVIYIFKKIQYFRIYSSINNSNPFRSLKFYFFTIAEYFAVANIRLTQTQEQISRKIFCLSAIVLYLLPRNIPLLYSNCNTHSLFSYSSLIFKLIDRKR